MTQKLPTVFVLLGLSLMAQDALATIVSVANPGIATEIGVRARNGLATAEVVMFDSLPTVTNVATLDAVGSPAWTYGDAYPFAATWDATTGQLQFSVDFNKNGTPGDVTSGPATETLTYVYPEFVGSGFTNISLVAQGRSSPVATMSLSNLVFNGSSVSSFTSVGNGAVTRHYASSTPGEVFGSINLTGELTLSGDGGIAARPVMELRLSGPASLLVPVPEPGGIVLLVLGGLCLARRRTR